MTTPVDTWRRISPAYFDACWNSTDRPHRQPILDAVASLMPAASLLEIGCNAGPNLRLIHERWPKIALGGVDANEMALAYVEEKFGDYAVDTWVDDLREYLPESVSGDYDIVLTSYCLAYIEPDEIADVLAHMVRIARVGLVIAEPTSYSGTSERVQAGIPEWKHDYHSMLCDGRIDDGTPCRTHIHIVDPPVERLNAVLTVKL